MYTTLLHMHKTIVFHCISSSQRGPAVIVPRMLDPPPLIHICKPYVRLCPIMTAEEQRLPRTGWRVTTSWKAFFHLQVGVNCFPAPREGLKLSFRAEVCKPYSSVSCSTMTAESDAWESSDLQTLCSIMTAEEQRLPRTGWRAATSSKAFFHLQVDVNCEVNPKIFF